MKENNIQEMGEEAPESSVVFRYIRGVASLEERERIQKWLMEDEAHEKELLQILRIYYAQYTKIRIQQRDPSAAFERVKKRLERNVQVYKMRRISLIAACFIGVLLFSNLFTYYIKRTSEISPQLVTITTNPGMRTQFDLPDGTIVHLNSGSTFSYPVPYDKKERKVSLSGEAYFNVAHVENQPFSVNVNYGRFNVKVLGTEFNLQAYDYDDEISTTLVSGLVMIEYEGNDEIVYNEKLYPSEKGIYNQSTFDFTKARINTQTETVWIKGALVFKNTPLPEVLKRLSHFYNVKFELKSPDIANYNFTGTFINRQLSQVLDYLKMSSNINYKINPALEDDSAGMKYSTIVLWEDK